MSIPTVFLNTWAETWRVMVRQYLPREYDGWTVEHVEAHAMPDIMPPGKRNGEMLVTATVRLRPPPTEPAD